MKFLCGFAVGAVGMWAYSSGNFRGFVGRTPASVQNAFNKASEQVNQVANNDQMRGFVAKAQDKAREIGTPTASEVSARPAEPSSMGEPQVTP